MKQLYEWDRARLTEIRKRHGESPEEFAAHAGVAPRTLRFWESGRQKPTVTALERLCATLGLDIRTFFRKVDGSRLESKS